jgi:A/G-specific adenine glycosylase
MRYPLKVEKKKAREELDVVCVIEWRPSRSSLSHTDNDSSDGRWFLLSRRPETGLLAGLHDFPSRAGLSTESGPKDPKALKEVAFEVLQEVLVTPPSRPTTTTKAQRNNLAMEGDVKRVRVKKIQLAGDVLHIFSHIRKTYRVQWVVLEGGGVGGDEGYRPPEVVKVQRERIEVDLDETEAEDDDDDGDKPKKKTKVVKGKAKGKGKGKAGKEGTVNKAKRVEDSKEPSLRWVKYEDVEKAK